MYTLASFGAVAQLGERCVRNAEARGSNPLSSTPPNPSHPGPTPRRRPKTSGCPVGPAGGGSVDPMRPPHLKDEPPPSNPDQLELAKAAIAAAAEITASMVSVTQEKNPAKISEAYRVIYKAVIDTVRGVHKKGLGV